MRMRNWGLIQMIIRLRLDHVIMERLTLVDFTLGA